MKFMKTGFISRLFLILLGVSLFEYALFHLAYVFVYESYGTIIYYVGSWFSEAWSILMPALAALATLFAFSDGGVKGAITSALILAASRISFLLLYYYMYFISQGFDSIESISFSFLTSLGLIALTFIETLAIFGAGLLILKKKAGSGGVAIKEFILPALGEHEPMDVGVTSTLTLAIMSLSVFAFRLIYTIYSTIVFFIEYGAGFSDSDIFSILFDYLFLLIMLIVTHLTLCVVKKKIYKSRVYTED